MRIKCVQSKNPHKCPSLFPFAIYQNQVSEFYIFFIYIYNHLALQIMLKQLILKSPPICLGWVYKKTVYVCVYTDFHSTLVIIEIIMKNHQKTLSDAGKLWLEWMPNYISRKEGLRVSGFWKQAHKKTHQPVMSSK